MKKIFFSILAITLLSTTAVFAEKGRTAKKHHAKKECPSNCPKTGDCSKMMHA
jgi:hypothetical protein